MKYPFEDPTWPECGSGEQGHYTADYSQSPPVQVGDKHWCEWTRAHMIGGNDQNRFMAGMRHVVPVVPSLDVFAEIALEDKPELAAIGMSPLFLVIPGDDFGLDTEKLHPLGLHTFGEGSMVIASTIQAWCEGMRPDRCEFHLHSYKHEMQLNQGKNNPTYVLANTSTLAMYERCIACYRDSTSAGVVPAGDFGMGGVTAPRGSGNDQNTLNQLQNRFGK